MRLKTNTNLTINLPLIGEYTGKVIGTVHSVYYGNNFNHLQIVYKLETEAGYCFSNSTLDLENKNVVFGEANYYEILKSFMAVTFELELSNIDLEA